MVTLLAAADTKLLSPVPVGNGDAADRTVIVQVPCLRLALGAGLGSWPTFGAVVGLIVAMLVAADAESLPPAPAEGDTAADSASIVQAPCLGLALCAGLAAWLAFGAVVGLIVAVR
jgi:type IV secretory pathway VirB2 component (pilin)